MMFALISRVFVLFVFVSGLVGDAAMNLEARRR
jgi:hypothetical protein